MTDEQLTALAERFCAAPLPRTVCADLCASDPNYSHQRYGTNLLTVSEAKQVLSHVLKCQTCDGYGYKDYASFQLDPCECAASAIEARRAETVTGSVHESAVSEAETPNPSQDTPNEE